MQRFRKQIDSIVGMKLGFPRATKRAAGICWPDAHPSIIYSISKRFSGIAKHYMSVRTSEQGSAASEQSSATGEQNSATSEQRSAVKQNRYATTMYFHEPG